MSKKIVPNDSKIILYASDDGEIKVDVRFQGETVWLSQQLMADLFQTTKQNISLHIKNIYNERELIPEATVKKYFTVQKEGGRRVKRTLDYYNFVFCHFCAFMDTKWTLDKVQVIENYS